MTPEQALLRELLVQLRRTEDAPLQASIDGPALARWALQRRPELDCPGTAVQLARWLVRCQATLRGVHPRALSIVALRLDGAADREIAEKLDLGARLVRCIRRDAREAWGR